MPVCVCVCVFVSARDTVFGLLIGTILWNKSGSFWCVWLLVCVCVIIWECMHVYVCMYWGNVQEISPGSHVYSAQRLDDQDLSAVLITLPGLPPLILQRPQAPLNSPILYTHVETDTHTWNTCTASGWFWYVYAYISRCVCICVHVLSFGPLGTTKTFPQVQSFFNFQWLGCTSDTEHKTKHNGSVQFVPRCFLHHLSVKVCIIILFYE